ncbi:hypothetical protein [Streptomyces sp. NPDC046727]|uniref:hypothetical protein n=1 Tax=Streptomyces sp. NPDC046727 TaxID=3155373 RepID=UPI0033E6EF78
MSSSHATTGTGQRDLPTAQDTNGDDDGTESSDTDPASQDSIPTSPGDQSDIGGGGGAEGAGGEGGAGGGEGGNFPSDDHDYSKDQSTPADHDYSQDQSHEPVAGQDYTGPNDFSQYQTHPWDAPPPVAPDENQHMMPGNPNPDPMPDDPYGWRTDLDNDLSHEDGEGLRGGRDVAPEIDTDFLYAP